MHRLLSAKRVCVIGPGTMGGGIAAHLANLGFQVDLLGVTLENAQEGLARVKSAKPPHFFVPEAAQRIRLGSIDNLGWAADADWVCEAVFEKLDVKRELFAQLDDLLPPTTAITTNTSGLEIRRLSEGRSDSFRSRFMGTHFFNPPRYLKLLELIPTPDTDPQWVQAMTSFLEERVARRVVPAKDTPGFIANRFGMWAMLHAIHVTEKLGLTIEQVDAITGPFLGRPRSASFRLNDLVGLDIMLDIARNLYERCPEDPHRSHLATPASMLSLLERGWIGEKVGQGYYRRDGKELLAFDLKTLAYRDRQEAVFSSIEALAKKPLGERIAAALDLKDEVGEFLRHHLVPVLAYANYLKEEISHGVLDFDRVMQWGFGWEMGPFAMIDAIGGSRFGLDQPFYREGEQRTFTGSYVALPQEPQYRKLSDFPVVEQTETLTIRDLGDGLPAVCLATKMGTIHPTVIRELRQYVETQSQPFVLTGESRHFSVGFDLNWFLTRIESEAFDEIERALIDLQDLAVLLSARPVTAAVQGYALGGGFELVIQCPRIVALSDSMMGFPEAKVGLLPAGGGTSEMALRTRQLDARSFVDAALRLTLGEVSTSADHARSMGYLRETDITVYHPDRLLSEVIRVAPSVQPATRPNWNELAGPLVGMIDREQSEFKAKGQLSDYDEQIGDRIKRIMARSASFEQGLTMERTLFLELCRQGLTQARIRHMLEIGKPLRN